MSQIRTNILTTTYPVVNTNLSHINEDTATTSIPLLDQSAIFNRTLQNFLVGDNNDETESEEENTNDEEVENDPTFNISNSNMNQNNQQNVNTLRAKQNNPNSSERSKQASSGNHGQKRFQCDFCKKEFKLRHHLTRHVRIHTGEKPYVCEFCGKAFVEDSGFRLHMRSHTDPNYLKFECDICKKRFPTKHSLITHSIKHTDERPFQCDICGIFILI